MNKNTAERLYDYRRANHFSQEELAEKIGVSRQAISKWERGESSPDTDNLIALARLYNITIDELINGSGTPEATVIKEEKAEDKSDNKFTYGEADDTAGFSGGNTDSNGNNKDYVHIGFDGIHVETDKDSVHIGADDINVRGRKKVRNPILHAALPLVCVILYLILGFTTSMGWATGWLLFLLIPIAESLYSAIVTKNPSSFCYPVLVVFLYLALGFVFGIWHPTWILFVTIPLFYVICDSIKKINAEKNGTQYNTQNGGTATYYSPNIDETKPHKKSNITAIIVAVICSLTIIAVVAISCAFGFLNRLDIGGIASDFATNFTDEFIDSDYYTYNDSRYTAGGAEIDEALVQNISIEWVAGNINIEYYDGSTIDFSENEQTNENYSLRYKVENGTLDIKYLKSGASRNLKDMKLSKDLTILIPRDKTIYNLDIEGVSATVNADIGINDLNVETVSGNVFANNILNEAEIDTVSGNIAITCPTNFNEISTNSVSGEVVITIPENINGFYISADSVSGRVNAPDFNISGKASDYYYGTGGGEISFSSVSGNLNIKAS